MAFRTYFRTESDEFSLILETADRHLTASFAPAYPGSKYIKNRHESLWAYMGSCMNLECSFLREKVLVAAVELQNAIKSDAELLPFVYSYEIRYENPPGLVMRGSGFSGGIHIDGKVYSLDAGPGYCFLQEWLLLPNGKGERGGIIDIRAQRKLEATTREGFRKTIKIYRRKIKSNLPNKLDELIAFLERSTDTHVRIRTTQPDPNMMDLIRAYAEGGGMDDWAGETLFEMGEEAQNELLRRLENTKSRRDHLTIAELLLMVFPSKKSRDAVENALERETNPERQKTLAMLLGATQNLP